MRKAFCFLLVVIFCLPSHAQTSESIEPFLIPEYDSIFFQLCAKLTTSADTSGICTGKTYYVLPGKKLEGSISLQKAGESLVYITFFCEKNGVSYCAQCDRYGVTFFKNKLAVVDVEGDENNYTVRWRGDPAEWEQMPEDIPPDELINLALVTLQH